MEIIEILKTAVPLMLLPILSISLLIFYMHKRDFLRKTGFDKPEVGLILVGSFFGLVADVPLIVSGETLLNINLGGALIPIIVCGSLIYKKRLKIWKLIVGITIVSVIAYRITRYEPSLGIVAEFPDFLLPSFIALVIAVLISILTKDDKYHHIPYAYTFAVLGNLIGADLVRIPLLVEEGIMGSIGGAGAMDLVYLSGLIAALLLVFMYYWNEPYRDPKSLVSESRGFLKRRDFRKSHKLIYKAVQGQLEKARKFMNISSTGPFYDSKELSEIDVLKYLNFHPLVIFDFMRFKEMKSSTSFEMAEKDFITGRLLKRSIEKKINSTVNSLGYRIIAYIIDLIVLLVPMFLILYYLFQRDIIGIQITAGTPEFQGRTILLALFSLLISIQFLYFTILEWSLGGSLGKLLLGLRVIDEDFDDLSFIQSSARNAGRYADMLLFFYIISIIVMLHSPADKRIGDYIAGSRVVKIK